jgi:hypothetical protein
MKQVAMKAKGMILLGVRRTLPPKNKPRSYLYAPAAQRQMPLKIPIAHSSMALARARCTCMHAYEFHLYP